MSVTTLRTTAEFQSHYQSGRKIITTHFVVFALPSSLCRFGVVASRKAIGNAVQRNRAKRIMREVFRSAVKAGHVQQGSYVMVARGPILQAAAEVVRKDFAQCLRKLS